MVPPHSGLSPLPPGAPSRKAESTHRCPQGARNGPEPAPRDRRRRRFRERQSGPGMGHLPGPDDRIPDAHRARPPLHEQHRRSPVRRLRRPWPRRGPRTDPGPRGPRRPRRTPPDRVLLAPRRPRPRTAGPGRGRPADGPRLERHSLRRPGRRLPRGGRPARRAARARPVRAGRPRPQQRGPRPEHHLLRLPRGGPARGPAPGRRRSRPWPPRTCARTPSSTRRWRSSSCRRPATRSAT